MTRHGRATLLACAVSLAAATTAARQAPGLALVGVGVNGSAVGLQRLRGAAARAGGRAVAPAPTGLVLGTFPALSSEFPAASAYAKYAAQPGTRKSASVSVENARLLLRAPAFRGASRLCPQAAAGGRSG